MTTFKFFRLFVTNGFPMMEFIGEEDGAKHRNIIEMARDKADWIRLHTQHAGPQTIMVVFTDSQHRVHEV